MKAWFRGIEKGRTVYHMWIGVGLLVFCKDSLPFFSNA